MKNDSISIIPCRGVGDIKTVCSICYSIKLSNSEAQIAHFSTMFLLTYFEMA